jgi:hypothetical protein
MVVISHSCGTPSRKQKTFHQNNLPQSSWWEHNLLGMMSDGIVVMPSNNDVLSPPLASEYSEYSSMQIVTCDKDTSTSKLNKKDHEEELDFDDIPTETLSASAPMVTTEKSHLPHLFHDDLIMSSSQPFVESSLMDWNIRPVSSDDQHHVTKRHLEDPSSSQSSCSSSSSSSSYSSAPPSYYKSPVHQLLEKMQQQHARHFREQNEKSLEFRRRMERVMYEKNKTKPHHESTSLPKHVEGAANNGAVVDMVIERPMKQKHDHNKISQHPSKNDAHLDLFATDNNTRPCTVSTANTGTSSWSIPSNDDVDDIEVGHDRLHMLRSDHPQMVHMSNATTVTNDESTSLVSLQKLIEQMKFEKSALESENKALRTLRLACKRRLTVEQEESCQLQRQLTLLKSSLEDVHTTNQQLQANLQESDTIQRKQRNHLLVRETEWKHRTDRIKRDFDKLWKEHKSSKKVLKESRQSIKDLQTQLDQYRNQERRSETEKTFLKDKVKFLQGKITALEATLKSVKDVNEQQCQAQPVESWELAIGI